MDKRKKRQFDKEKIFSVVASLAIVAALVFGVVSIVKSTSSGKKNYIDLNVAKETTPAKDGIKEAKVDDAKKQEQKETKKHESETKKISETEPVTEKTKEQETEPVTEPATVVASQNIETQAEPVSGPIYNFGEDSNLIWPVAGEIILGYNMDNTIYFPTLDQYKCNPSIIVSAPVGNNVLSAAAGVVKDIYEDSILGTVMVVSIGDGYELRYGQLSDLQVGISDNVEVGQVLAKVDEPTRYFTVEGSNLYFELTKDGMPMDPMLYLNEDK